MSRFVIRGWVRPHFYYASLQTGTSAIAEVLGQSIADVVTIQSAPSPEGGEVLQVALLRPTHVEVFEDVLRAVERAGYSMIEAEVSEIVDEAAGGAVAGFVGGGVPGALIENPIVALVGAAAGWWAGRIVGASLKRVGAVHRYEFFSARGWIDTEITREVKARSTDPARAGRQTSLDLGGTPDPAF